MTDVRPQPGHGALYGRQWQPSDIARQCYNAGSAWQEVKTLITAVATCLSESNGYDRAIHVNLPTPAFPDGSEDRGWWQINSIHTDMTDDLCYDVVASTEFAYNKLYLPKKAAGGVGFEDWNGFSKKVYLRDTYILRATRGVANFIVGELYQLPTDILNNGVPYVHATTFPYLDFEYRVIAMNDALGVIRSQVNAIDSAKTLADAKTKAHTAAVTIGNAQKLHTS